MSCDARTFPAEIDRLFTGELEAREKRSLREHLAGCASCRAYYSRLSAVQRRLSPDEPLGRGLLDGDDLIARFSGTSARRRLPWIVGSFGALAAAAIVLLALRPPALQERGGTSPTHVLGARAFCLSALAEGRHEVAGSAALDPAPGAASLRCPLGGALQLAYRSDGAGPRYLFVVGIGPDGSVQHYAPHSDQPASLALQTAATEVVLPDSTLLAPHHVVGATTILALFSSAPLTIAAVDQAIAQGGAAAARKLAQEVHELRLEVVP
jgi:hypothetical protein